MSVSKISSNATPFWKNGHYYSMSEEKKDWYAARSAAQMQILMDYMDI